MSRTLPSYVTAVFRKVRIISAYLPDDVIDYLAGVPRLDGVRLNHAACAAVEGGRPAVFAAGVDGEKRATTRRRSSSGKRTRMGAPEN